MIMKYHNHKLQTNPLHRVKESHNNNETPGIQTKQSNPVNMIAKPVLDKSNAQQSKEQ